MKQNLSLYQNLKLRRMVALALLALAFAIDGFTQYPLWAIGNKVVNFQNPNPDLDVSTLPEPNPIAGYPIHYFYNGELPNYVQHSQFDGGGNLLFFIIDGRIYNASGYLIADSYLSDNSGNWPHMGSQSQLSITAFPGSCTKFIIFYGTQFAPATQAQAQFVVLNLLSPSTLYSGIEIQGALENAGFVEENYLQINANWYFALPAINSYVNNGDYVDNYALALNFNSPVYHGFGPGGLKTGEIHWEVIESANNGPKQIFLMIQGVLVRLKLEENGITEAISWEIQSEGTSRNPEGEIEATYNTALNIWQIIVSDTHASGSFSVETNMVVVNLDANFNYVSATNISIGNEPLVNTNQYGLEISPNGRYAYFSISQAPHFGYVDLNDNSVHNLNFTIFNDQLFIQSRMEKNVYTDGINQAIYLSSSGNLLGAIVNPENPTSSSWNASVNLSNSIGTIPTYHNYFNNTVLYRNFQNQNYNGAQIQNFLATTGCCLAQANVFGIQGMTITATNDGTWTYGDNPFNNSMVPVRIVEDLIFEPGTTTNISNMVIEFDVDADIIMKVGSKVYLNGSTLTSISCAKIMWPGVDLFGTTNTASSIDQVPLSNNPDQGYLFMNNSTIENAIQAVDVGTTLANKGGGIIKAYNSKFRNNQIDVIFRKYHFINSSGNYIQNKSLFNNCTFITDDHLNQAGLTPSSHVMMYDVDKINFTNCSFMNTTPLTIYNWVTRGTGIFSSKSSFVVDGLNDIWNGQSSDPDQTTFYKLRYGIRSFGSNSPLAFYTCKQQEFQQCLYGIINYNTDNVQIYQNNFQLPEAVGYSSDGTMERGIYLTNSTGYTVEQNFFDGFNDPTYNDTYPCAMGVWVDNSGDAANEIRNNDFDEMKLGTYVTRNNLALSSTEQAGLQVLCNTYSSGQTDIFRDDNALMRHDQGGNQPGGFLNAGNRFSSNNCNGSISDFVIDPDNYVYTNYWCHNNANTVPDCGGVSSITGDELLTVSVDATNDYNDADCPNTYGDPIIIDPNPGLISGLIGELQTVRAELEDAKDTYLQVVDDSQKQSTLDILSEAFPHESGFYRNLLMQRYPLSDEVLKQLIIAASRLSSWHLTEVFLANSPLSKEIMYKVEEANILSSFFMSFLYDVDSGASLRRLMELNMLSLATERDQLIQSIARAGLTYETEAESETDQPIYINDYLYQFAMQDGSTALRIRAASFAAIGDYNSAMALVANEPLLVSYHSILQMEQSLGGDWSLLNSSQITALWDIYNSKKDYSSSLALSILQQIGVADFEPEPRVPIQYRSLHIAKDKISEELPLLGVWPNPASGSAWLHYPLEADEQATIQIFDPQGRLVQSFQPNTKGLVELSLKNYESGIYVVQLIAFDKVVENIKLTVINQN